ncbi:MAG: endonuclease [Sphingomonadales bacterium]|nr:endonuclease [Sphingomonadales bacterium]
MRPAWILTLLLAGILAWPAAADEGFGPPNPVSSFSKAKRLARDDVYADHHTTLYCACQFTPNKKGTGGTIGTRAGIFNAEGCGYEVRKSETRGRRLEWEHIVPASRFGQRLACWQEGHPVCVTSKGKPYRGRKCCAKVNEEFEHAEADLHNLAPSVGELNGDRSNHPYDILAPEDEADETATPQATAKHRLYGTCNFEVDGRPKAAEPMPDIRGDVARIWFYMSRAYDFDLSPASFDLFAGWHAADPVEEAGDAWEKQRDRRIQAIQGNSNPYIHGLEPIPEDFGVEP